MGRPRLYGMKSSYIPNARADMQFNKKLYQRGREYTDKHEAVVQEIWERLEMKRLERMKADAAGHIAQH